MVRRSPRYVTIWLPESSATLALMNFLAVAIRHDNSFDVSDAILRNGWTPGEADFRFVDVADTRDDRLIEQRVADFHFWMRE